MSLQIAYRFSVPIRVFRSVLFAAAVATSVLAQTPTPPAARIVAKLDTTHGDIRTDHYFWLRDRKNPEVVAYLEAENRFTDAVMEHTKALQQTLYDEMVGRIKETDLSVPERDGEYFYYSRTEKGKQYPIIARKRGSLDAPEEILLEQNEMAAGHQYFRVGVTRVSPDHRLLAFTVDTTGAEYFTLVVKDLASGRMLADRIHRVHFAVEWANDNKTLFYTMTDSAQRSDRVVRHTLGADPASDAVVFHEPNVLFDVSVYRTKSRRYLMIPVSSFTSSEIRYLDADRPAEAFRVLHPREKDVLYEAEHHGNRFLIVTNDRATNFKLMEAPVADPSKGKWKEVIAPRDSALLDGIEVFRNYLVVYEREKALRRIRILNFANGAQHQVEFPEPVYTFRQNANPEFDTNVLRFTYMSLVTPNSVFDYDMNTRERELKKRTDVLGGYDPSLYQTERTFARASDGAMVPISLVYRKPLVRDGARPMLLYAYGSYGSSTDPVFSSNTLSLLDRGFVYAIAHIRGGQELGRAWYDQGKLLNKKNTFTDFILSAEHLVREKYTSRDRLAIRGGSAGGLLMGAVVNMRPDLFKVVIADVPFVDVINTMLDASIPLTAGEWEQWGDPRKKEYYDYMKSYSPYDNVVRKAYPAMLVTTGLNDPRVAYWEPAKWVAKLRTLKTDSNTLLLKTNMGAGHGGASGRYDALREMAFRYAFLLDQLGIEQKPAIVGAKR